MPPYFLFELYKKTIERMSSYFELYHKTIEIMSPYFLFKLYYKTIERMCGSHQGSEKKEAEDKDDTW